MSAAVVQRVRILLAGDSGLLFTTHLSPFCTGSKSDLPGNLQGPSQLRCLSYLPQTQVWICPSPAPEPFWVCTALREENLNPSAASIPKLHDTTLACLSSFTSSLLPREPLVLSHMTFWFRCIWFPCNQSNGCPWIKEENGSVRFIIKVIGPHPNPKSHSPETTIIHFFWLFILVLTFESPNNTRFTDF